ncbi:MAG: hypothetical protein K0B02_03585 [DPANN group archaeon]|nr:hypothetical protein [DPANN group archaeon]
MTASAIPIVVTTSSSSNGPSYAYGDGYCSVYETCETSQDDCGPCETNEPEICIEDRSCSEWSECLDNTKERFCTDLSTCNTTTDKPLETQGCEMPLSEEDILKVETLNILTSAQDTITKPEAKIYLNDALYQYELGNYDNAKALANLALNTEAAIVSETVIQTPTGLASYNTS